MPECPVRTVTQYKQLHQYNKYINIMCIYLLLFVSVCVQHVKVMIYPVNLIGQLGELKGPFQNGFSRVITISRFYKVKQRPLILTLKPYCLRIQDQYKS
jgi:hypothetical protein